MNDEKQKTEKGIINLLNPPAGGLQFIEEGTYLFHENSSTLELIKAPLQKHDLNFISDVSRKGFETVGGLAQLGVESIDKDIPFKFLIKSIQQILDSMKYQLDKHTIDNFDYDEKWNIQ